MSDTDPRLAAGVAAGIISSAQAEALDRLWSQGPAPAGSLATPRTGDEPFAFFRGFRDVFLALGIIIVVAGLMILASDSLSFFSKPQAEPIDIGIFAAFAAALFGFGQVATRMLRMPLASLVVATGFSLAFSGAFLGLLSLAGVIALRSDGPQIAIGAGFAASALLYCAVYRLPVALALVAGGIAFAAGGVLKAVLPGDLSMAFPAAFPALFLTLGVAVFALAMRFDLSDPERATRRSENAFWLHLVAAPLIVHGLIGLTGLSVPETLFDIAVIFAFVLGLGLLALLIDRRAFLVSALFYLGGAISVAINGLGLEDGTQLALTFLVLGAGVVALALGWHPLRRALLSLLPDPVALALPRVQEG